MFSALTLGSLIYVLDKTSSPVYKTGEVIGVSYPKISPYNMAGTVDLKVKIDGDILEFNSIPGVNTYITYNNGRVIISETKLGIQTEVENLLLSSRQIVDNIDLYKLNISECEEILKQLNPQFAVDKERDLRLSNLETRFDGVESKLDKIFNLILK